MNPQSRSPLLPPARADGSPDGARRADTLRATPLDEPLANLPSLAHILAHYRRHGTVAGSLVADWPGAAAPTLPAAPAAEFLLEPLDGTPRRPHEPTPLDPRRDNRLRR